MPVLTVTKLELRRLEAAKCRCWFDGGTPKKTVVIKDDGYALAGDRAPGGRHGRLYETYFCLEKLVL